MVALFVPVAEAPASPVRLDCETAIQADATGRLAARDRGPSSLRIALELQGRRIASVLIEGPPLFSSYRLARTAEGSPRQLVLPRNLRWRGHFQGRALRLRREGMDMVLEPARGATETYSGFWTYVLTVGSDRIEVPGTIQCRTVAGTLNESAPA